MVRFGEFEFDPESRELRRRGAPVSLQAQPAMVLATLLEHADTVVSREELQAAVWGDGTFVDFERGLNFCMTQIRAALGDDAVRPVYIRTIPRKGYQFIAPLQRDAAPEQAKAPEGQRHRPLRRWAPVALAILVVASAAAFWLWRETHRSQPPPPILAVVRFDNETNHPELQNFIDGLTDDVVVQLTADSSGRYRVVGNAPILRGPRDQRDLKAIGASLDARYAVMGQVRADGSKVLILAHLIRLSDLTHVWVVRQERDNGDPLRLEADAAGDIAGQFSQAMANMPDRATSFRSPGR
jgi:DNA-binding winged helix-turn-helix (wHTH) protein/TolB-like protein